MFSEYEQIVADLHFIGGYTDDEIAAKLRVDKVRIEQTLKKIRRKLERCGEEYGGNCS